MKKSESMLKLIGSTPLVQLNEVAKGTDATILVKLEFYNPTGSVKDRIALTMLEEAEKKGIINPKNTTIVETTTGNTGISLAMVCALKGYKFKAIMSEAMSVERRKLMEAYGAELVLVKSQVPGRYSEEEAIAVREKGKELSKLPNHWRPDQFNNPDNVKAHLITGKEILEQTGGKLDGFAACVGTAGTFVGVTKVLKQYNPKIKAAIVEPVLPASSKAQGYHRITGAKKELIPGVLDFSLVDEFIEVDDDDAIKMARRLAEEEGIFGGVSSGANVVGAIRFAEKMGKGKVIVTIIPDSGQRYLSVPWF